MSAPVDVLAVMDDCTPYDMRMDAARAAVAELIEAAEGVETVYAEMGKALPGLVGTPGFDIVQDAVRKSRAALARVRGAE